MCFIFTYTSYIYCHHAQNHVKSSPNILQPGYTRTPAYPYTRVLCLQRFSELCENRRVSSHQILKGRTDRQKTTLRVMNDQTCKGGDVMMFTGTDIVT